MHRLRWHFWAPLQILLLEACPSGGGCSAGFTGGGIPSSGRYRVLHPSPVSSASHMQPPVLQRSLLRHKPPSSNCEECLKAPCRSPWGTCRCSWGSITESGMGGLGLQMQPRNPPSLFTIMPGAADHGEKWGPQVPSWHSCHVTRTAGIATACLSSLLQSTTWTQSGNSFLQHSQHTLCP